tara:strand:+ start:12861 stop:13310 length:450 start_codon:yes stop_codon:yes gene_type:complete
MNMMNPFITGMIPTTETQSIPFSEFGNTPGGQSIPFSETEFSPLSYGRGSVVPDVDAMTQYMAGRDMDYFEDAPGVGTNFYGPIPPNNKTGLLGGRGFMNEDLFEREAYMNMEPGQKRMTMTTSPRTPFDLDAFKASMGLMNMGLGLLD